MHRVADLEPGQVDVEMIGDGVGGAAHLDLVAHHVEHAAALQPGGGGLVQEMHRHLDGDQGILAEPQEIDMDREIADRIELHGAGDHPRLGAVDVEGEDGALEMAGEELLRDRPIFDRDRLRVLLVAVKDAGNAPLAARGARAALA